MNSFTCRRCGNCCRVSGYVHLREAEIERIAAYLNLSVREFNDRFTCLTDTRAGLSLVERPDHSCIFLEADATCRIQAVKPEQCRNFPLKWNFTDWDKLCQGRRS
ncbi:MAG: YkgJ family cysteine cluster protein [Planctomycetota bacterium]